MPEARLIDANAFAEQYGNYYAEEGPENGFIGTVGDLIAKQPTIESEPVRHGRWIEKPPYADETVKGLEFQIVCSWCDEQNASITFDENSVPIAKTFYRTRYCPNCGARMDATDTNVGGKGDEEMDLSPLDFLAAEYCRKHPQGIRFVDWMEGADDGACKKV